MDWMVQEQERGVTITSAATTCFWKDRDGKDTTSRSSTPRATLTSRPRSSAACASSTVPSPSSTPSPASSRSPRPFGVRLPSYNVPRIAFINKFDRIGSDFFHAIDTMTRAPGTLRLSPRRFPWAPRPTSGVVIDLVTMTAWDFKEDSKGMTYPEPMDDNP